MCGVGMVIQLGVNNSFRLCMNVGKGSNNRAVILSLWGLLYFSKVQGIGLQLVLGDSQVIIEWGMHRYNLQSLVLSYWIGRVIKLLDEFLRLPCQHIYCEFNSQADLLSKQGIDLAPGSICWKELSNDGIIAEGFLCCL